MEEAIKSANNNKDKDRSNCSLLVYGEGDGGGGPHDHMLEQMTRLKDLDGIPKVQVNQFIH